MAKDPASGMVAFSCHSSIRLPNLRVAYPYALSYRGTAMAWYGTVNEARVRSNDRKTEANADGIIIW
jgi:hypothetical protein